MRNLLADSISGTTTIHLQPGGQAGAIQSFTVPSIIGAFITLALVVAAIIFFFMLVIGGIRWITSGGDKGQTEAARGQITAALIGLVIVFAAWAIATLVGSLFGFNIFNLAIPSISSFTGTGGSIP